MAFAKHEDVVQILTPDGLQETLGKGVCRRCAGSVPGTPGAIVTGPSSIGLSGLGMTNTSVTPTAGAGLMALAGSGVEV